MIVVDPEATEVTSPAGETVAISASDVTQLTVGLAIVLSFASLTVAVSWVVLPSDQNESAVWDNSTLAAT